MESTDKCNAVISHFNGKFIKTAPGTLGKYIHTCWLFNFLLMIVVMIIMIIIIII